MAKNQRERSRLRDAFLGFPASLDPEPISEISTPLNPPITEAPEVEDHRKISHPKQPRTWEDLTYGTSTTQR